MFPAGLFGRLRTVAAAKPRRRPVEYGGALSADGFGRHEHREQPAFERDRAQHRASESIGAPVHHRRNLDSHSLGQSAALPLERYRMYGGRQRDGVLLPFLPTHCRLESRRTRGSVSFRLGNGCLDEQPPAGTVYFSGGTLAGADFRPAGSHPCRRSHYDGLYLAGDRGRQRAILGFDFHPPRFSDRPVGALSGDILLQVVLFSPPARASKCPGSDRAGPFACPCGCPPCEEIFTRAGKRRISRTWNGRSSCRSDSHSRRSNRSGPRTRDISCPLRPSRWECNVSRHATRRSSTC